MEVNIEVQEIGESIKEAIIAKWHKQDGDYVKTDEEVLELESDKANLPLRASAAGKLTILKEEESTVAIGEVVGKIDTSVAAPAEESTPEVKEEAPANNQPQTYASGHPSPAARDLMEKHGINSSAVQGTGKDARITKADVLKHIEQSSKAKQTTPPAKPATPAPAKPKVVGAREVEAKKMTPLRKTIAKRLVQSQQTAALLTTFNEIDMKPLMDLRKKYKDEFYETHGTGLGFMSFFTKAAVRALQEYPVINASVDGENIVYHHYCDVGIAVSTPKGLIVPILRNAEQMTFSEIEAQIKDYAKRGREGRITMDEITGGTFTISNGGVFGSMLSTPIVNPPQSGILGMHNIVERPVVKNGEIVIRPVMYVALSYDHRIIDGSESVRFLVKIKQLIEEPERLLLDL